jgi:3-oxoacyl-[acyl-carrier-protein] synthase-3
VCAKHFDLSLSFSDRPTGEQVNGLLFGDGAGAAVLSTAEAEGTVRLRRVFVELDGMDRAPGQTVEWFGLADRHAERPGAFEDYKAIEESVPVMAVETLESLLEELDWKKSDLDYLLPPQLSGRMTERIARRLDVPSAAEISCVATTGNTGNALPFFQLEQALPRMSPHQRAVLIAIESSKWIKAGIALEG